MFLCACVHYHIFCFVFVCVCGGGLYFFTKGNTFWDNLFTFQVRGGGGCIFFTKGNNFWDNLFTFQDDRTLPEMDLFLKERICSIQKGGKNENSKFASSENVLFILIPVNSVFQDHDGHGPEFHKHMYRINKEAGTNITVI